MDTPCWDSQSSAVRQSAVFYSIGIHFRYSLGTPIELGYSAMSSMASGSTCHPAISYLNCQIRTNCWLLLSASQPICDAKQWRHVRKQIHHRGFADLENHTPADEHLNHGFCRLRLFGRGETDYDVLAVGRCGL